MNFLYRKDNKYSKVLAVCGSLISFPHPSFCLSVYLLFVSSSSLYSFSLFHVFSCWFFSLPLQLQLIWLRALTVKRRLREPFTSHPAGIWGVFVLVRTEMFYVLRSTKTNISLSQLVIAKTCTEPCGPSLSSVDYRSLDIA